MLALLNSSIQTHSLMGVCKRVVSYMKLGLSTGCIVQAKGKVRPTDLTL